MNRLRRFWIALPGAMRLGFGALGLGIVADLAYHLAFGLEPKHHDAAAVAPFAIHVTVALGMALSLIGVASAALDHRRRSTRPEGGR